MKYKRCIILLADGSKFDVFKELLDQGSLPNIKQHIVEPGTFTKAVSAFPSTTGPAHIPFLTGCLPATCNIPGIRWFDRHKYATEGHGSIFSLGAHGRYRSYVGLETFRINTDMRSDIYNVFELLPRSYCIFNSINRGVGSRNLTRIMRIWYWYYGHLTDRWRFVDESAVRKSLRLFDRDFEFLFVVMPAIDEFAHLAHPRHEATLQQYEALDGHVGRLVEKLKKTGKWNDTLFWIVSDHGLSATHTHFCINTFLEKRGIETFYFPIVFKKKFDAVNMMSGNGMTHLYFKKGSVIASPGGAKQSPACTCAGWSEPSTLEDIEDMHPGLLDELLNEEAVDILAGRDRDGYIVARSKRGKARLKLHGDEIEYHVDGTDPFGYESNVAQDFSPAKCVAQTFRSANIGRSKDLRYTIDTDYPDAPYQLAHIFHSPRCGDVILSAKPGFDLRLKYEDPEHKSSHGSLHREHMIVPLLCNAPLGGRIGRTVDVFPTYLKLMGHSVLENIDGESLI